MRHQIIVRGDLPTGTAMAMVVHAAGESVNGPVPIGTHAVVLSVPDETALQNLSAALGGRGVVHHCVFEPDLPWDGQIMAIGLPPGPRSKLLSGLALYPKDEP